VEKIQQAIERARQQRASVAGRTPAAAAPHAPQGSPAAPAGGLEAALQGVRVFRPSPQHLLDQRVLAGVNDDPRSDVFRKLRTQAMLRLQALNGRSIAVVSARDGEGKTLVACNLALGIAHQTGAPTFLLDMDFRRPSVHKSFGFEPEHSLADAIEGHVDLEDVVVRIGESQLYVLPQGRKNQHASELVGSQAARMLLQTLANGVPSAKLIVDCPPLLLTDEPLVIQGYVDGCLLVVEQGRTARDDVERATEYLDETKYLGSVLNRVVESEGSTYYGYR
jgi:capsular exopolysaccharide synthesis family protein